jgi:hypothetical protein
MADLTLSGHAPSLFLTHPPSTFNTSTGGIKDSALYREHPPMVYRHGQYQDISEENRQKSLAKNKIFYLDPSELSDTSSGSKFDDFYSPIEPESYIRHRVMPQLEFYQNRFKRARTNVRVCYNASRRRIPSSSSKNVATQIALVATSAGNRHHP